MITPIIQTFEREYDSHIIPSLMNHTQIVDYLNSGKIDIAIVENTPELQTQLFQLRLYMKKHIIYTYLKTMLLPYHLIRP